MFESNLVRFRAYEKEDMETVRTFINDPETASGIRPGIFFPYRHEEEEAWYNTIRSDSQTDYTFAIELKADGTYIGGCSINKISAKNRNAILGVLIGKPFWNKGYGTDAMSLLVDFCFLEVNLYKVKLRVISYNKRAMRCYEKVGFRTEGVMKDEIYRYGKFHDDIAMAIFRADWEKRRSVES